MPEAIDPEFPPKDAAAPYLRALLDSELRKHNGHPTPECVAAFAELIEISYAQNAAAMMKPPQPEIQQ